MVGRLELLEEEVLPVDFLEETVTFDILHTVLQVTIALREIAAKKMLHETLALPTVESIVSIYIKYGKML